MDIWSIQMDISTALGNIHPIKKEWGTMCHTCSMQVTCWFSLELIRSQCWRWIVCQEKFASYTGLSINKNKSKMFFSKGSKKRQLLWSLIGIPERTLPVWYLGIPLSINYLKASHFPVLLNKCRGRMEGWTAQTLSFAGRNELIKTVLHGMVAYWIHSFKIPASSCKEIEKLFPNFLWKGKMHAYSCTELRRRRRHQHDFRH